MERGGYAVEDVDALLNQFFSVLASNPAGLTGAGMRGIHFRSIPVRPGYAPEQVDQWIQTVANQLDQRDNQSSGTVHESPASTVAAQPSPPPPAPYDELERGFDLPSELHVPMTSTGPIDPATDPGRNAVRELPTTPTWATVTVLVVLLAMIAYTAYAYLR